MNFENEAFFQEKWFSIERRPLKSWKRFKYLGLLKKGRPNHFSPLTQYISYLYSFSIKRKKFYFNKRGNGSISFGYYMLLGRNKAIEESSEGKGDICYFWKKEGILSVHFEFMLQIKVNLPIFEIYSFLNISLWFQISLCFLNSSYLTESLMQAQVKMVSFTEISIESLLLILSCLKNPLKISSRAKFIHRKILSWYNFFWIY